MEPGSMGAKAIFESWNHKQESKFSKTGIDEEEFADLQLQAGADGKVSKTVFW